MKIVIDKDAEIKKLEDMLETLTDDKDKQSVRFAINLIEGFEERPQGEWIEGYHDSFETLDCSLCGYVRNERYSKMDFCPNCGAKMKGGEGNEQ